MEPFIFSTWQLWPAIPLGLPGILVQANRAKILVQEKTPQLPMNIGSFTIVGIFFLSVFHSGKTIGLNMHRDCLI